MRLSHLFIALFLATGLSFTSCNKEGEEIVDFSVITEGEPWKITQMIHHGEDKTSKYSGHVISFMFDGTILSTVNNNMQHNGTWAVEMENSDDDMPQSNSQKLMITFSQKAMEELSEDWQIETSKSKMLKLVHESGGSSMMDILVFER